MMSSSSNWKRVGVFLPVLGSLAVLAAFTTPPIGRPADANAAMWQLSSALVERCSAVCIVYSNPPSPSMTFLRLTEYKAQTKAVLDGTWWVDASQAVPVTNRLTSSNVLVLAGLGQDFWTNTPLSGVATASNGITGLRAVLTNMKWTAVTGYVGNCISNCAGGGSCSVTNAQLTAVYDPCNPCPAPQACTIGNAETNLLYTYTALCPPVGSPQGPIPTASFPIGEARKVTVLTTNYTYEAHERIDSYDTTDPFGLSCTPVILFDSSTNWIASRCGMYDPLVTTNCQAEERLVQITTIVITNTITDPCASNYLCGPKYEVAAWGKQAGIGFTFCASNAVSNLTFTASEWYVGSAPSVCFATVWSNASGTALSTNWGELFTEAGSTITNGNICRADFAHYRIPWSGSASTNPVGWQVDGAVMLQKWNFTY